MGDKSPKAKQRNKNHKDAASEQAKRSKEKQQQNFASRSAKEPKK